MNRVLNEVSATDQMRNGSKLNFIPNTGSETFTLSTSDTHVTKKQQNLRNLSVPPSVS